MQRVGIIGAGAAGCFCAIEMKRRIPSSEITLYEAGKRPLAKVAITGGGRCNLTNTFEGISSLSEVYPRGDRLMKRLFKRFDHKSTCEWFESEGVRLAFQEDRCIFPASQDAMEIVGTLNRLMKQLGIKVKTNFKVKEIRRHDEGGFLIRSTDDHEGRADVAVVATGGSPRAEGFDFLAGLGLEIVPPVPSLFTFNLAGNPLRELMGTVVENATASLAGTRYSANGPLLITHWGMSGPCILKLSSHAARHLAEKGYRAKLLINWLSLNEEEIRERLTRTAGEHKQRQISNTRPEEIPARLWTHLMTKAEIRPDSKWIELGGKGFNRLCNTLLNDEYDITGKSRFREEFVTCGGIALNTLDPNTLESRVNPGLYFAGEVTDVDAVTGGFNLQAAWTMGHIAAVAASARIKELAP